MTNKNTAAAPPIPERSVTFQRMALLFDEWNKRYCADPEAFGDNVGLDGNPDSGYGEACAAYFYELAAELDGKNLLPKAK